MVPRENKTMLNQNLSGQTKSFMVFYVQSANQFLGQADSAAFTERL